MTPDESFVRALTHLRDEEYRQAWVALRLAVARYEALEGSGRQLARCHHALGSVFLHLERFEAAVSAFSDSLALLETVEDSEDDRAHCLLFLGIALAETGNAPEAASALFQAFGDQRRVAVCQAQLAMIDRRGERATDRRTSPSPNAPWVLLLISVRVPEASVPRSGGHDLFRRLLLARSRR